MNVMLCVWFLVFIFGSHSLSLTYTAAMNFPNGETTTPLAVTSGTNTQETPSALPSVIKDYQTLEIALPIAILTIIIVVAIVAVGVLFCLKTRLGKRSSSRYSRELLESSQTALSPATKASDKSALYRKSNPQ